MKTRLFILCIAMLTLIVGSVGLASAQGQAKWTIIVYIAGDNDLEPFAINDLIEMQNVGSSDEVNIVVQLDRAEGYESLHGDWTDTRRYYVTPGSDVVSSGDFEISRDNFLDAIRQASPDDFGLTQEQFDAEVSALEEAPQEVIESIILGYTPPAGGGSPTIGLQQVALESAGEVNTGTPEAMVDYVTWAIENYPADHYVLNLWNHGGGWTGFGWDEGNGHDGLTLPELDQALSTITTQSDIDKFDIIMFDACLMAQVEVLQVLAPYAEYTLAAEEVIPGAGYEYATPLNTLVQNPDMSAMELGQVFVDSYMTYYSEVVTNYPGFDLNLIDLSSADQLIAALDQFSSVIQANPAGSLEAIGKARNNTQTFGGSSPDEIDAMSSVDLIHFMQLLTLLTMDVEVSTAAQGVMEASNAMIAYHRSNAGLPDANGLAIFFPRNRSAFEIQNHHTDYPNQAPPVMGSWIDFLNTFHGTATETFAAADLTMNITSVLPAGGVSSIYDPPVVLFETNGQGVVNIAFYAALQLDNNVQIVVDASPLEFPVIMPDGEEINELPNGYSLNEFAWNVEMPVITDGMNSAPTVLLSNPDLPNNSTVSGIYIWADGRQSEASLVFDLETRSVISVWAAQDFGSGGTLAEISPRRGDHFMPTWRFLDATGQLVLQPSDILLTFGDQPFTFDFVPADSGQYILTMLIEDMAGNISVDSAALTVDNTDLDTSYRGFKDVSFGMNFLYPWSWADPAVIQNEDEGISLAVSDMDGNMSILVDAYEVSSADEALDIALGNAEMFDEAVIYESEYVDLNGYEAYIFQYDYAGEEGAYIGGIMAIYVPENETGYIIDIDAPESMFDEWATIFDLVARTVSFFEPME